MTLIAEAQFLTALAKPNIAPIPIQDLFGMWYGIQTVCKYRMWH